MAYSLHYNKQFVYYSSPTDNLEASPVAYLLERDQSQLELESSALLKCAECFKNSDRNFIFDVIDRSFSAREDAVNLIKFFISGRGRVSEISNPVALVESSKGEQHKRGSVAEI